MSARHFVMPEDEWLKLCAAQCKARKRLGPAYYDSDECGQGEPCRECAEDAAERVPAKYVTTAEAAALAGPLPGM